MNLIRRAKAKRKPTGPKPEPTPGWTDGYLAAFDRYLAAETLTDLLDARADMGAILDEHGIET